MQLKCLKGKHQVFGRLVHWSTYELGKCQNRTTIEIGIEKTWHGPLLHGKLWYFPVVPVAKTTVAYIL